MHLNSPCLPLSFSVLPSPLSLQVICESPLLPLSTLPPLLLSPSPISFPSEYELFQTEAAAAAKAVQAAVSSSQTAADLWVDSLVAMREQMQQGAARQAKLPLVA